VTLDDPEDRIDARSAGRDEPNADAGRSTGFGQDLSLEPIFPHRHLDELGDHTGIAQRCG
jgi:hypothetical protein